MAKNPVYVVIGTRAQFIKVAPLMRIMQNRRIPYTLIYTAQHRENIDEILKIYELPNPDVTLYNQVEANTKGSFLRWFVTILFQVLFQAKTYIPEPGILLTHGDTFTAWLGALMGKRAGCIVGHIESGFRSYNIFSPFPEEISRLITFKLADIYFCSDEWAKNNLQSYKGEKIILGANTMLDGVRFALKYHHFGSFEFQNSPYVIVSLHRYENIFTTRLTQTIIPSLKFIAQDHQLIFTLHPTTRERLIELDLFDELNSQENVKLFNRFNFVDWIQICSKAKFVITDGGSNQEELTYLGIPTLLFRNETERQEGLGQNVVISKFDKNVIIDFMDHLDRYTRNVSQSDIRPSEKIVQYILSHWESS